MWLSLDAVHRGLHRLLEARGAHGKLVTVRGRQVHFYDQPGTGSGPLALLVHGLGGNAYSWAALLRPLARHVRRVVAVDLPGHGRSPLLPGEAQPGLVELGDTLVGLLDALGEPVVIVGNSLGGALGLYAARARERLVRGWVGLAPAGAPLSPEEVRAVQRAFGGGLIGARELLKKLYHRVPPVTWLVLRDLSVHWDSASVRTLLDDIGRPQAVGPLELAAIPQPALVLWGERDGLLPESGPAFFRAHLKAGSVELLPGVGHLPQLEAPGLVAERIARFLAALPSAS